MVTKRLARMHTWIEANPLRIYADYRDTVSDDQAAMLLKGDFTGFDESWFEVEISYSDATYWDEWEAEFASEFGYDSWDEMPTRIQDLARDHRYIDTSDVLRCSLRNWSGHICARLIKRNGDYIEFPHHYNCSAENKSMQGYLKRHCGIDGWKGEATYPSTWLTVLGRIDLWELYQAQKLPTQVYLTKDCFTIGHEPCNGSGTCGDDQYKGKSRWMNALFFVDGTRGYGVDSIFGLTGKCWSNDLKVR